MTVQFISEDLGHNGAEVAVQKDHIRPNVKKLSKWQTSATLPYLYGPCTLIVYEGRHDFDGRSIGDKRG
jgi:hypothetical protein